MARTVRLDVALELEEEIGDPVALVLQALMDADLPVASVTVARRPRGRGKV